MPEQNYEVAIVSLTGNRKINQDRAVLLRDPKTVVMALGDGLGGHPRGEFAAQLFIDTCERLFNDYPKPLTDPLDFMLNAVEHSHDAILDFGSRQTPQISPRTTAVIAVIQLGMLYWLHVGDSRLYLMRDGKLKKLTKDHAIVREIETRKHGKVQRRSGVTRCLGSVNGPCGGTTGHPLKLKPGDALLACSDGLWDQVSNEDILAAMSSDAPFPAEIKNLAHTAESSTPKSDNVTGVGLRISKSAKTVANKDHQDTMLDVAVEQLKGMVNRVNNN